MVITPTSFRLLILLTVVAAMPAGMGQESAKSAQADQWIVLVQGLLGLASIIGLLRFRWWSRPLALLTTVMNSAVVSAEGHVVLTGWLYALTDLASMLWALVLALAFFSPLRHHFRKGVASGALADEPMPAWDADRLATPAATRSGPGFFSAKVPRGGGRAPQEAWSLLVRLTLVGVAIHLARDFYEVGFNGVFTSSGLPAAFFDFAMVCFTAWLVALTSRRPDQALPLAVTFTAIGIPIAVLYQVVDALVEAGVMSLPGQARDVYHVAILAYAMAAGVAVLRQLPVSAGRRVVGFFLAAALLGVPLATVYRDSTLWQAPFDPQAAAERRHRANILDHEAIFYRQPELLERDLAALKPSGTEGIDLYFVGFAGDSRQDVFKRDVEYARDLFRQRYGTQDREVLLINNPATVNDVPIASVTGLQRTLKRIGGLMRPDRDILFLYLDSHGSPDHKLELSLGRMRFDVLDPGRLRALLDESGIRRRVIVVSACYSGGFIDALKTEDTLVMTAAAPDKSSFGCSDDADLTEFARAYFAEALGPTTSFIEAFERARNLIAARERKENLTPSDPRMFVGDGIRMALAEFRRQQLASNVR